ncbi:MAG: type II toxin-antitoxin system VapC family toxin [Elsteraceae bacterium]
MTAFVLDSSAVMAVMFGEPGQEKVVATLPGALLSTVNLSEIIAKLTMRGVNAQEAENAIRRLGVECLDFSAAQARIAGDLRSLTKSVGLSLGDRACLALGIERRAEILTADRAWAALNLPVAVSLIR